MTISRPGRQFKSPEKGTIYAAKVTYNSEKDTLLNIHLALEIWTAIWVTISGSILICAIWRSW